MLLLGRKHSLLSLWPDALCPAFVNHVISLVSFPFDSVWIEKQHSEAAEKRMCCLTQMKQGGFVLAEPLWGRRVSNTWLIFGNVPAGYGCWSESDVFLQMKLPRQCHADSVGQNSNNSSTNLVHDDNPVYYLYRSALLCQFGLWRLSNICWPELLSLVEKTVDKKTKDKNH